MSQFPSLEEFEDGHTEALDIPSTGAGAGEGSFLERERAALGDDAHQFATPNDNVATVEDADDFEGDLLGGGGAGGGAAAAGGEDDILGFESSFPAIDTTNDHMAPGGTITGHMPYRPATPEEEPEVIAQWRAKRDADIARRDELSGERKAATIKEAQQAIDDFYDTYNDKKEKNVAQTRREADEFLANRDDTTAGGTSWERIAKLVDLSGKGMKGGAAGMGKERFREMLVSLKKDQGAPGATGV